MDEKPQVQACVGRSKVRHRLNLHLLRNAPLLRFCTSACMLQRSAAGSLSAPRAVCFGDGASWMCFAVWNSPNPLKWLLATTREQCNVCACEVGTHKRLHPPLNANEHRRDLSLVQAAGETGACPAYSTANLELFSLKMSVISLPEWTTTSSP